MQAVAFAVLGTELLEGDLGRARAVHSFRVAPEHKDDVLPWGDVSCIVVHSINYLV